MKSPQFNKPTLEEVTRLFQLKGVNSADQAAQFFYHYESNGWYVGKAKMRSWRAAVAGWILRMNQFDKSPEQPKNIGLDTSGKSSAIKASEQQQILRAYNNQRQ